MFRRFSIIFVQIYKYIATKRPCLAHARIATALFASNVAPGSRNLVQSHGAGRTGPEQGGFLRATACKACKAARRALPRAAPPKGTSHYASPLPHPPPHCGIGSGRILSRCGTIVGSAISSTGKAAPPLLGLVEEQLQVEAHLDVARIELVRSCERTDGANGASGADTVRGQECGRAGFDSPVTRATTAVASMGTSPAAMRCESVCVRGTETCSRAIRMPCVCVSIDSQSPCV